jgi:hypothetical protein
VRHATALAITVTVTAAMLAGGCSGTPQTASPRPAGASTPAGPATPTQQTTSPEGGTDPTGTPGTGGNDPAAAPGDGDVQAPLDDVGHLLDQLDTQVDADTATSTDTD